MARAASIRGMRTVQDDATVRLYHLDDDGGEIATLFYGSLAEALRVAAAQPEATQAGLFLQTSSDVIGYVDFMDN